MSLDGKNTTTIADEIENAAAEAAKLEAEAQATPDSGSYTHRFQKPFGYQGTECEQLHFNWSALTGADYLAIETEMLMRGKTLVSPEFSGDFLCGIAARACMDRNENGFRVLTVDAMKAMPLRDFSTILKNARAFLLRAGS